VLKETLRKYPPLPTLNRECSREYRIPGTNVTVEKGIHVVIPVEAIHNDPQYFPEPDRFDPERFSDEAKSKRHHYVYLPFGEGPRICIGNYFNQCPVHGYYLCLSAPLKSNPECLRRKGR
jgi:cytochrome P450 family 6